MGAVEWTCAGQRLELLPDRAIWLPDHRTLLVADVHVGKGGSFRKLGVPVPRGATANSLERLSALLATRPVRRLVLLGDLLHSPVSQEPRTVDALARWRREHDGIEMTLVRGNHDARAGDPPSTLGIDAVDEPLRVEGLALCHHPQVVRNAYALAGHWHPCVHIGGRAGDRLRLPCYWFGAEHETPVGVLPAFGGFTGMHPIERRPNDRVWVVAGARVVELPRQHVAEPLSGIPASAAAYTRAP